MGLEQTNRKVLDRQDDLEVVLEILSFAGGVNTVSEDQACKTEEARVIENWEATSLGGMQRSRGFNQVADGGASYTGAPDFLMQHQDTGGTQIYAIIEGDLVYKNGSSFTNDDNNAFTSGVLSHGVSAKDSGKLWITNSTDNLKMKAVGVAIATPSSVPSTACARLYRHKNRLIAEGSVSFPYRIYGSRVSVGNWTAADAWSLANDAFSIDLPADTRGCVPNFPTGNEVMVFTEDNSYAISNFPNTSFRPLSLPGRGCSAPYSIAQGDEGVYFLSRRPTLGVFLYDGSQFKELTYFNRDVFVDTIDFSKRIFGSYINNEYRLFFNELDSGVSYPNRLWVYDAKFGRWMERPVASGLSDNFGYPAVLNYTNNEIYVASSQKDKIYELETDDDSDEGNSTEAVYTTKDFSSRDFSVASGGSFGLDDVRLKLTKMVITYYGTTGSIGVQWTADRGLHSGSKVIDLTASGDLLNTTFVVNQSNIVSLPPDRTKTVPFPNDAVGKRFNFSITNSGTSTRAKIKKIRIHANAQEDS